MSFVDGDGWISDDSDFYGDYECRRKLEQECRRDLPPCRIFSRSGDRGNSAESFATVAASPDSEAVAFLKSRPQVKAVQDKIIRIQTHGDGQVQLSRPVQEASDLLTHGLSSELSAVCGADESVSAFLRRLPVSDPLTAQAGPWLWIHSQTDRQGQREHLKHSNTESLREIGGALLSTFQQRRQDLEAAQPRKAAASITRALGPLRDKLEDDVLAAAIATGTTCGKWMLFPTREDLPRVWSLVAEATHEGKLGPVSKVGTYNSSSPSGGTLICAYTYNFADIEDVGRVLRELFDLGLCSKEARPTYYKCDAYTLLDIASDNEYKLRASLFSSKDFSQDGTKTPKGGAIGRLLKTSQRE